MKANDGRRKLTDVEIGDSLPAVCLFVQPEAILGSRRPVGSADTVNDSIKIANA
jgi:hypothetical protein